MTATDNLKRSVFQTDLANDPEGQTWQAFGALETYAEEGADGISRKVILYRAPRGSICDISNTTAASLETTKGQRGLRLRNELGSPRKQLPPDQQISFDILISSFETDSSEFTGSFTQHNGSSSVTRPWRGFFLTYRDSPLSVIQAGQQPLPSDVKAFLDISPLTTDGNNEAQTWADSLFTDLTVHALPQRAINFFFKGNVGEIGSRFADEKMHGRLPDALKSSTGNYLNPEFILKDNRNLCFLAGMHVICRFLKREDWFHKYETYVQDKVEPFFKMVGCPADASQATVDALKASYGSSLPAAQGLDILRSQYQNAVVRCYYAAYACFRPSLAESLQKTDFMSTIAETLRSNQYREHWLPTLVQLPSTPKGIPVVGQLSMLNDKLEFLLSMDARAKGQTINLQPAHDIISMLATDAKHTGLVRSSMINPSPEKTPLGLQNIFDENNLQNLQILNAMAFALRGGRLVNQVLPGQVERLMTHDWLKEDATPLGLYTWDNSCTIL